MFDRNVVISVQASYLLYVNAMGVLTCDNVINVPLCFAIKKQNKIDNTEHTVLPAIEVVKPVSMSEFKIITNEGITVEPFTTLGMSDQANPYFEPRTFFVLPRDATGIKSVIAKTKSDSHKTSLEFGIMPPPYVYDTALNGSSAYIINYHAQQISTLNKNVESLDGRVDALENKKTYYGYIRNNGGHTIDFSKPGSTFIIKPDTRFIVFSLTNASSQNTPFEITLTSVRDEAIHTKSTVILPSGRSILKMDLQSLEMYVMSADNNAKSVYNISGVQDSYHGGIKFGYIHNQNLTGNVEVHEWA